MRHAVFSLIKYSCLIRCAVLSTLYPSVGCGLNENHGHLLANVIGIHTCGCSSYCGCWSRECCHRPSSTRRSRECCHRPSSTRHHRRRILMCGRCAGSGWYPQYYERRVLPEVHSISRWPASRRAVCERVVWDRKALPYQNPIKCLHYHNHWRTAKQKCSLPVAYREAQFFSILISQILLYFKPNSIPKLAQRGIVT